MCLNLSFSRQPATWEHVPRQTDQDPPPSALRLPSPESVTRAGQGGGSPKPLRRLHAHHPRCVSPLVGRSRKVHGCILRRRRSHRRHYGEATDVITVIGAPLEAALRVTRNSGPPAPPAAALARGPLAVGGNTPRRPAWRPMRQSKKRTAARFSLAGGSEACRRPLPTAPAEHMADPFGLGKHRRRLDGPHRP